MARAWGTTPDRLRGLTGEEWTAMLSQLAWEADQRKAAADTDDDT